MILDVVEKVYLFGFIFLQLFVTLFPVVMGGRDHLSREDSPEELEGASTSGAMEFLPLMVTSVYCAIGLVWAYIRLIYVYMYDESTYQGQLSTIQ